MVIRPSLCFYLLPIGEERGIQRVEFQQVTLSVHPWYRVQVVATGEHGFKHEGPYGSVNYEDLR